MNAPQHDDAEVERLATTLARIDGSSAFSPHLPDEPERQPARDHYRRLARAVLAAQAPLWADALTCARAHVDGTEGADAASQRLLLALDSEYAATWKRLEEGITS